jgi:hypothetical protein
MKPRLTFSRGQWWCCDPIDTRPPDWCAGWGSTPASAYARWHERKHGIGALMRQWQAERDAKRERDRIKAGHPPSPDYARNAAAEPAPAAREGLLNLAQMRVWLESPPVILHPAPVAFGDKPAPPGSLVRIAFDPPARTWFARLAEFLRSSPR